MTKLKTIFFIITLSFFVTNYSFGKENKEDMLEVAFYEAGFLFNDGVGIDKDIILELEKRLGTKYKHTVKPRARIWYELSEGLLPISVSGIETEERKKFAWFIPYVAQKNKAIILKEYPEKYNELEDFLKDRNAKVAVVRGFSHGIFYDEMLKKIESDRINEVPNMENLFILLKNKRVDLVISLSGFYRYEFKNLDMEDSVSIKDWDNEDIGVIYGGLILSKKYFNQEDYEKIYDIFIAMKNDGTLKKIILKYLPEDEADESLRLLDLKFFQRDNP